jgi:hypothetical protein
MSEAMSPIRKEQVCQRKEGHMTMRIAYEVWLEIRDRKFHDNSPMTVYLCELCGLFHLGHMPPETTAHRSKLCWTMDEVEEELARLGEEVPRERRVDIYIKESNAGAANRGL